LDETITEAVNFLFNIGVDLDNMIGDTPLFDKLEELRNAYDTIISKDASKDRFKVLMNTMVNLYDASKPEIFGSSTIIKNVMLSPRAAMMPGTTSK
jgi:type I restriction enzyme R subunit